jgi:hypothetical protein
MQHIPPSVPFVGVAVELYLQVVDPLEQSAIAGVAFSANVVRAAACLACIELGVRDVG